MAYYNERITLISFLLGMYIFMNDFYHLTLTVGLGHSFGLSRVYIYDQFESRPDMKIVGHKTTITTLRLVWYSSLRQRSSMYIVWWHILAYGSFS